MATVQECQDRVSKVQSNWEAAQVALRKAQEEVSAARKALEEAKSVQAQADALAVKYLKFCQGGVVEHDFEVKYLQETQDGRWDRIPIPRFRIGYDGKWDPFDRYDYHDQWIPGRVTVKGKLVCRRCNIEVDFDKA